MLLRYVLSNTEVLRTMTISRLSCIRSIIVVCGVKTGKSNGQYTSVVVIEASLAKPDESATIFVRHCRGNLVSRRKCASLNRDGMSGGSVQSS